MRSNSPCNECFFFSVFSVGQLWTDTPIHFIDFEGNSTYNAAVRIIKTELNERGGEWLFDGQIGSNPRFANSNRGVKVSARCSGVAPSYHLFTQNPVKRRFLKISIPFGMESGCKLIAP